MDESLMSANQPAKSKGPMIIIGIAIILAAVVLILWQQKPRPAPEANTNAEESVKTFTVTGKNFSFDPAEIRVQQGDKVRIVFQNESGYHDWVLDEFNVRAKQMTGPATETVEFIADKTGTFEYYCSVGTHRANGMKGNLIVE